MTVVWLALLMGVVAGSRSMMAPAAVSWAARLGWIDVTGSWLAWLGYAWTPWIVTLFALGELVADQLPSTPSRTLPPSFAFRIASGALCGVAIAMAASSGIAGAVAGAVGAVVGTLGGRAMRGSLAAAFGHDRPAALLEDALAIGAAFLIALSLR